MEDHASIIGKWPSAAEFGRDLGITPNHASMMRRENSIPSKYWLTVIDKAKERGIRKVNLNVLAETQRNRVRA